MKENSLKMVVTLVVIVLMGLSTDLLAQRGNGNGQRNGSGNGNGNGYAFGNCQNIPSLTDAQKTSIEKLQLKQKKEMLQHSNKLRELQAKLNTQRTADNASITEINKTVDAITAVKNKQMKQREAHKQEIRNLLTADQRVMFDSRQARKNGKGNRGGKKGKKGNRGGNGNGNGQGRF